MCSCQCLHCSCLYCVTLCSTAQNKRRKIESCVCNNDVSTSSNGSTWFSPNLYTSLCRTVITLSSCIIKRELNRRPWIVCEASFFPDHPVVSIFRGSARSAAACSLVLLGRFVPIFSAPTGGEFSSWSWDPPPQSQHLHRVTPPWHSHDFLRAL